MALSPNQAARQAGVSRRTIMVAIEKMALKAQRNNRNHWRVEEDDLSAWMAAREADGVRVSDTTADVIIGGISDDGWSKYQSENSALQVEVDLLREQIDQVKAGYERQIDQLKSGHDAERAAWRSQLEDAKADREHWREFAQRKPRWWPF